ncbi:hypothetical protein OG301_00180 [Streptomyces platensis]|uniref:hypothetical protein n=1 Tax=Streptomyces platensis TaxID=58346 RepID=UPI002ED04C68|nr:hypothetical protein OG301_00180 [Streptomyces platensis]
MTTDTPAPAGTGPRHLSPRDEARVALARSAWRVHREAHARIPVDPDAPAGDLLRQALELEEMVQQLVQRAVVAERERGTTWEQIARAAGTTRQSAHERWSGNVQSWANLGRTALTETPTADRVAFLDQEYARLDPDRPDAVSAGLDATRHPGSAAYEDAQRARGQQLHARRAEMERDDKRTDTEYKRLEDPSDRDGWLRLAANRTASADLQDALAEVYDELITAEPALAEEHRASAEKRRGYATNSRDYAELALKRAGEL